MVLRAGVNPAPAMIEEMLVDFEDFCCNNSVNLFLVPRLCPKPRRRRLQKIRFLAEPGNEKKRDDLLIYGEQGKVKKDSYRHFAWR